MARCIWTSPRIVDPSPSLPAHNSMLFLCHRNHVAACHSARRASRLYFMFNVSGKRSISRRHMSTLRCKALATYGRTWRGKMGDEHQLADDILKLVLQCCYYDDLVRDRSTALIWPPRPQGSVGSLNTGAGFIAQFLTHPITLCWCR